ncbi:hypothetical protein [Kineococcus sp. SYSU DK006]|uniref:hypothetical protein n=1 Tax=Kineococcus sp. SYSU DK006 TaxID=3383127 RepID=UPI003D7D98F9
MTGRPEVPAVLDVAAGVVGAMLAEGAGCHTAPSDRCALSVVEVLRERGLAVPGDLSVTGRDGTGDLAV